jgi:cyclohexanecarboxylate-CoA ligase
VREEMGVTVAHDYGMTEVPMICVSSPKDTDEQLANSDGRPIPGNEVRIVDDAVVLPAGADGEIQVRGAAVCHGYTDPVLDAQAFTPDGWFRTGDIGAVDPLSGHLVIRGRIKELIITGGLNVYPREVEIALERHPAVAEAAVAAVPHQRWGEQVTAWVVLRPGCSFAEDDLVAHARTLLAPYKCPKRVFQLAEIPRNQLGKVNRSALAAQLPDA